MSGAVDVSLEGARGGEYDDAVRYDAEYGGIDDDGRFFLDLAARSGSRILDLGCGTGRLAIPLCEAGKQVTGLDFTPAMLDHARRKSAGLPIRWVAGDFRDFDLGERYDLAISCAHAFQGLLTEPDQRRYFACVLRHLAPGGRLAFDTRNVAPIHLEAPPGEQHWHDYTDANGDRIASSGTQRYEPDTGLMRYECIRVNRRTGERSTSRIAIKFTPLDRLRAIMADCGFAIEAVYGSYRRDPWMPESAEIVVVSRPSASLDGPAPIL